MKANAPPPVIDLGRVIAYAIVDDDVKWTGRQRLYVNDDLLGVVPRLAICQQVVGELKDYLLFHCNEDWGNLGTTGAKTVEAVKANAERWYSGISSKWIHTEVSVEDAKIWLREKYPDFKDEF